MPELADITQLILKHLPPSADLPRVRPLDDRARRWCLALDRQHGMASTGELVVDATVASDLAHLPAAVASLRPNGRAIFLIPNAEGVTTESIVEALASNGLKRILAESVLDHSFILARGERPTDQLRTTDRMASIAQVHPLIELFAPIDAAQRYSHLHLLVKQQPPSRGWDDMQPGTTWEAITAHDAQSNQSVLIAFTSLVKAVAFMQPAVLAGAIHDVNKLPRFETARMIGWSHALLINPTFEALRDAWRPTDVPVERRAWADPRFDFDSPPLSIDPALALKSNE